MRDVICRGTVVFAVDMSRRIMGLHALIVKISRGQTDAERNELGEQMSELVFPAYLYDSSKMGEGIALSKATGMNAMTGHLIQQSVDNYDLTKGFLQFLRPPTLFKELRTLSIPHCRENTSADPRRKAQCACKLRPFRLG